MRAIYSSDAVLPLSPTKVAGVAGDTNGGWLQQSLSEVFVQCCINWGGEGIIENAMVEVGILPGGKWANSSICQCPYLYKWSLS